MSYNNEKEAIIALYNHVMSSFHKMIGKLPDNKWESVYTKLIKRHRSLEKEYEEYKKKKREVSKELQAKQSKHGTLSQKTDVTESIQYMQNELIPTMTEATKWEHILNVKSKEIQLNRALRTSVLTRDTKMEKTITHSVVLFSIFTLLKDFLAIPEGTSEEEIRNLLGLEEGDPVEDIISALHCVKSSIPNLKPNTKDPILDFITAYGVTSFEDTELTLEIGKVSFLEICKQAADELGVPYVGMQTEVEEKKEEANLVLANQFKQGFSSLYDSLDKECKELDSSEESYAEKKKELEEKLSTIREVLSGLNNYFFNDLVSMVDEAKVQMKEMNKDKSRFVPMVQKRVVPYANVIWKDSTLSEQNGLYLTLTILCATTSLDGWDLAFLCM